MVWIRLLSHNRDESNQYILVLYYVTPVVVLYYVTPVVVLYKQCCIVF